MTPDELYGLICYHILVKNDPAPSYLAEKFEIIGEGKQAFAHLDVFNKGYALGYCDKWNINIPPEWQEALNYELDAYADLQAKGIIK